MMRPVNQIMAGGTVLVGAYLSGKTVEAGLLLPTAAAALAVGYGNVINDLHDVPTDRISHPERPLPRGDISYGGALAFMVLLALASLVAGGLYSPLYAGATIVPLLLLTAYSLSLKSTVLAGNIAVSLLISYTLIYGGLTASVQALIFPAFLAGSVNMMREVVKDYQDYSGDRRQGFVTTAVLGKLFLRRFLLITSVFISLCAGYAYYAGVISRLFLASYACGVIPVLAAAFYASQKERYARAAMLYKITLLTGLCLLVADTYSTG
ncbi:MAG: UbiA family prenyltransferase [Fibrobacterota bacterium]